MTTQEAFGPFCWFCHEPINPNDSWTWHRLKGWGRVAHRASGASGSDVALRERVEGLAHDRCIRKEQRGVSAAQGSFL